MKELEFETSKGRFVVFNAITDDFDGFKYKTNYYFKGRIIKLSEITEEQASIIVDSNDEYGVVMYQNYQTTSMQYFDEQITAIESLHSLLKSKGIHLFKNPYVSKINPLEYKEAKGKTFYNPYIFKL